MLGLRNSHDKSLPIGISLGNFVFVCDNLAFVGDHVIKRKHTANAKHDLPGLIGEVIEPLALQREAQAKKIVRYKGTALDQPKADHAIMNMYRAGILGVTKIADILDQFDDPRHDCEERTAWMLFNLVTSSLAGRVAERPKITTDLHRVIDSVCE
jgi:hypothetical protein